MFYGKPTNTTIEYCLSRSLETLEIQSILYCWWTIPVKTSLLPCNFKKKMAILFQRAHFTSLNIFRGMLVVYHEKKNNVLLTGNAWSQYYHMNSGFSETLSINVKNKPFTSCQAVSRPQCPLSCQLDWTKLTKVLWKLYYLLSFLVTHLWSRNGIWCLILSHVPQLWSYILGYDLSP